MTNYNDGKWHGWNGGECPVHPETVVEVVTCTGRRNPFKGKHFNWDMAPNQENIIAFRVIKEHKEPREFWIFSGHVFSTFDYALTFAHGKAGRIIHVREVLK